MKAITGEPCFSAIIIAALIPLMFGACSDQEKERTVAPASDGTAIMRKITADLEKANKGLEAARDEVDLYRAENARLERELASVRSELENEKLRVHTARSLGKAEGKLEVLARDVPPQVTASRAPAPANAAARPVAVSRDTAEHPFWKTYQGVGVLKTIRADADERWGTNYEMVEFSMKSQKAAYEKLIEYKKSYDHVTKGVIAAAEERWGTNYEMVVFSIKEQLEAKSRLDGR